MIIDPEQTLAELLRAAGEQDANLASAAAESLRAWIVRGGFVPTAAFTAKTESEVRIVIGLIIDGAMYRKRLAAVVSPAKCNHGHLWGSNDCGQCDGFNRPIKRRKGGGK